MRRFHKTNGKKHQGLGTDHGNPDHPKGFMSRLTDRDIAIAKWKYATRKASRDLMGTIRAARPKTDDSLLQ
jgi:hypothetical protein